MSKLEITEQYAFDERQAYYYVNSARYLGLAEKTSHNGKTVYTLTSEGRKIMGTNYKKRQLSLCRLILSHKVFREVMTLYFSRGYIPDSKDVKNIMHSSQLYNIGSGSTFHRRAQTIRKWAEWISGLITE